MDLGEAKVSCVILRVDLDSLEVVDQSTFVIFFLVVDFPQNEENVTFQKVDFSPESWNIRGVRSLQPFAIENGPLAETLRELEIVFEEKEICQVLHRQRVCVINFVRLEEKGCGFFSLG